MTTCKWRRTRSSQLNIKQLLDDLWSLTLPTHPFNHDPAGVAGANMVAKTAAQEDHISPRRRLNSLFNEKIVEELMNCLLLMKGQILGQFNVSICQEAVEPKVSRHRHY